MKRSSLPAVLAALAALASSALAQPTPNPEPGSRASNAGLALVGNSPLDHYVATIEGWHAGRVKRLIAPEGYLALIGRHPLEPGKWTVGSAEHNTLRLAAGPANLGTLTRQGTTVRFAFAPGTEGSIDGTSGREAELVHGGEHPTYVRSGTINFYILESGEKLFVRVRDSEAERRKNFVGIERFPVDPAWLMEAKWVEFEKPETIRITNVLGITTNERCPGKAVFTYQGKSYELRPMQEKPGDQLFFVITDTTAGDETYEASRFVYADAPENGKVILDFNKVYNPPCAFTPFTTCPLPPKGNALPFPLRAGEKKYRGAH